VFTDLGAQAPAINRLIRQLGPFSQAARPALRTLGRAAQIGGPALVASRPTIRDLRAFARSARPVARNGALLLDSLQKTGGIERLMDYIFYQVAAINGFDQFGHYLRAALIVNLCTTYATTPAPGCSANFEAELAGASRLSAQERRQLLDNAAALAGRERSVEGARAGDAGGAAAPKPAIPKIALPGRLDEVLSGAGQGGDLKAGVEAGAKTDAPPPDPRTGLMDYLLGSEPK
jgi:hypothetical protein